jgi:hypothetical protein
VQKKKLKLGQWNIGAQKGLFKYDAETFEREVVEQRVVSDVRSGVGRDVEQVANEYDGNNLNDNDLEADADREVEDELAADIMGLDEDYDDGSDWYNEY